jgi:hypothetical protein
MVWLSCWSLQKTAKPGRPDHFFSFQEGSEDVFTKSGNPGYLVDQPILAGRLNSTANKYDVVRNMNSR